MPTTPTPMRILLLPLLATVFLPAPGRSTETPEPAAESVSTRWLADPFPNLPPRAPDRQVILEAGMTSRTPSVLLGVYDVENDPVTLASFRQPQHGRLVSNDDGTFDYTPAAGFVGDDQFAFTLADRRGAASRATMRIQVIQPADGWSTTSFVELAEVQAGGKPLNFPTAAVPRAVDWDADGRIDVLVGAGGGVTLLRNIGAPQQAVFASGEIIEAGGHPLRAGPGRVSISIVDLDRDGRSDLVAVGEDRRVRWARHLGLDGSRPRLGEPVLLKAADGAEFVVPDVRAEFADWNGDTFPDLITGTFSGEVLLALNTGSPEAPAFKLPRRALDTAGQTIEGSYNLNVRVADLNQDGRPDLVDSYNWGTLNFRLNVGSRTAPRVQPPGRFSVTGPGFITPDLHALTDGPLVDFADFNGDGVIDMVMGGERRGPIRLAFGESGRGYLAAITRLIAAHPDDLGAFLADPAHAAARDRMQTLQGALCDYVTSFATPSQIREITRGLLELIRRFPVYFRHQPHDLEARPGIPSLAVQVWLTTLVADYLNPEHRRALAEAAGFSGGYRRLLEEDGLLYADNAQNPRGAEAIHQWLRTIPREVYPGTGITANDWLGGGRGFLVRGHLKNTFNGSPEARGEYGFGPDARAIIGDRGSENWFMTVVHHEACHDLDAYVRRFPERHRRWGQVLVRAGGPDMQADPETGWFSRELTRRHFRERGLWDGAADTWDAAWKRYWAEEPGLGWSRFGFMRGNIPWFYDAPQESLATQGNQFWNSTEGRLEVAIDRWQRGYRSNLSEVLFFLEIWSLGLDKMKFYETDDACRQVIRFARLRRNAAGFIDRVDLGDRCYEFGIDADGNVIELRHVPAR
ncbi:MAG: VCBS repeat-containing protein [Verrucomicrobiales bacterium]|nr:VCBS repeat-containing protein [Verrucomicrobiales bacterium]